MILNNIERRNSLYFAFIHRIRQIFRQIISVVEDRPIITGSTVLTCCKGDGQSQWKTAIFGPSQLGNPLTDFDKI